MLVLRTMFQNDTSIYGFRSVIETHQWLLHEEQFNNFNYPIVSLITPKLLWIDDELA